MTVARPPVVAAPLTRSEEGSVADPTRTSRAALGDGRVSSQLFHGLGHMTLDAGGKMFFGIQIRRNAGTLSQRREFGAMSGCSTLQQVTLCSVKLTDLRKMSFPPASNVMWPSPCQLQRCRPMPRRAMTLSVPRPGATRPTPFHVIYGRPTVMWPSPIALVWPSRRA